MKDTDHQMVFCIVNAGYSQAVIDATRKAGAKGGTIIHGRGTANREAEEIFHISIHPDKEIVMILVDKNIKDDVLLAVNKEAGLDTAGQGIAFSMPVDRVMGLNN